MTIKLPIFIHNGNVINGIEISIQELAEQLTFSERCNLIIALNKLNDEIPAYPKQEPVEELQTCDFCGKGFNPVTNPGALLFGIPNKKEIMYVSKRHACATCYPKIGIVPEKEVIKKECSCKKPRPIRLTDNLGETSICWNDECGLPIPSTKHHCDDHSCPLCFNPGNYDDNEPKPFPNAGLRTPDVTPPIPEEKTCDNCKYPCPKGKKGVCKMWEPKPESKIEIELVNFGDTVRLYADTDEVWHIIEKIENKLNELIQEFRKRRG